MRGAREAPSALPTSHPAAIGGTIRKCDGGRGGGSSGKRPRLPVLRPAAAAHHLWAPTGLATGSGAGSPLPESLQGTGGLLRADLRLHPKEAVGAGGGPSGAGGCGPRRGVGGRPGGFPERPAGGAGRRWGSLCCGQRSPAREWVWAAGEASSGPGRVSRAMSGRQRLGEGR